MFYYINERKMRMKKIIKRDGSIVDFDISKIHNAIKKAYGSIYDSLDVLEPEISDITKDVENCINKRNFNTYPTIEEIQDIVEDKILDYDRKVYKAFALYRDRHNVERKEDIIRKNIMKNYENYVDENDWAVNENANMAYSNQGWNNYVTGKQNASIWLNHVYDKKIRKAHEKGDLHIHDLSLLTPYCCGWSLKDLLLKGFGGVEGKIESSPPSHFGSALGQIVNFLYTLQGEAAGAQALSNVDTYLAPFIRKDKLTYKEVKQRLQEHMFSMNVPTRVGFQSPFTNYTLDVTVPKIMEKEPIIIGGKYSETETYGDFQKEMDIFNKAFAEVMLEGDAKGRQFSFPIPTYNITKEFDWDNEVVDKIMEMTSKYGIPSFCNYVNSDLSPEDATSMCCRLRLDRRELWKRGGSQFGSAPLTGSIGVVTINLARLGYLTKGNEKDFFLRLRYLMEIARESLLLKRKFVEKRTRGGFYPYSKYYLEDTFSRTGNYWTNHFSTIGINGMNECLKNYFNPFVDMGTLKGIAFAEKVIDFMRDVITQFQEEDKTIVYNLEATPAEGTGYKLALKDKKEFPDIITAGDKEPYYTNSTQLPVNYTNDLFEALELQESLQTKYTGGTTFHAYLGEQIPPEVCKKLVNKIVNGFKIPYFTISPTYSVCPDHGYNEGEHFNCPTCGKESEVWARVVGFNRPVKQFNKGKKEEYKERTMFEICNTNL